LREAQYFAQVRFPKACDWTTVAVATSRRLAAGDAGVAYLNARDELREQAVAVRIVSDAQLRGLQGEEAVDEALAAVAQYCQP
jgi:hypothetical protein